MPGRKMWGATELKMNKKKLKMIPSTMREGNRYLLLKSDQSKVEKAILKYVGELGYAKAGPQFIRKGSYLILRISHDQMNDIRSALAFANIACLGTSGTIEALMEKFGK